MKRFERPLQWHDRGLRNRVLHDRVAVLVALMSAALLFGAMGGPASAASSADSWAYDLAGEVMSPFCPGRTLAACPSPQAAELIQWVILQEQAGATRAEVEDQLYARYGDVIRGAPKPEGWGLAAYVIPLLAAIAGVALVYIVLRRLSGGRAVAGDATQPATAGSAPTTSGPPSDDDDEIARLVDQELERI